MNFFGVSLDSMSVCLDGNLCGLREDLRNWLLATAGINPAVIERLVATLDEEEVESLDDLRKFAGAAGGRFLDARLTVTTARKIQNGLRGTPVLGAAPTPTPTPTTTSAPAMMAGCNASQPVCDIRIAESSTGLLAGPELHASGPERPTDGLPLYSALGPLPCDMLRLRGMVAAATRLQAEWRLWRMRFILDMNYINSTFPW